MPDVKVRCSDYNHIENDQATAVFGVWADGDAIEFDSDVKPTEPRSEAFQMAAGAAVHRAVGPSPVDYITASRLAPVNSDARLAEEVRG